MNPVKTILIDDEPRGLNALKKLLELNCPELGIAATCLTAASAREKINELQPQLVFLDINMPGQSGLDLLNDLEEIPFEIIFVTAHNTYMTQAFHFSAIDYILKPVDEELLVAAVKRACRRIGEKQGKEQVQALLHNIREKDSVQKLKLCIPSLKGFQVVDIRDILYAEANSNYTNFHFSNRPVICSSRPLHEYEELLSDSTFVRVHKSFIVNLEHVKEYIRGEGGSIILSGGTEVEVARRKKDLFLTRMKEFYKF